ncbi:DUF3341 domain-containing protein [Chondromyces crocatus]|uniref:DUF3341 domain-containing protein n=1 Tax=Chondromyces crocatus TaxID=52 RepID=A0A0K1EMR3_CHOCO|nr:DUF3341 domain-containing protein [Chondromyces crocatus]AKT42134.1 uncharacterized protein CMC5_063570 [Chondromyces crocatus]
MKPALLAEFETPEALLSAIEALHARGYRKLDAFTPYPVHGLEKALRLPRSKLPWMVLPFALTGGGGCYSLQLYLNGIDYPINVGGRPPHSAPAFIPITFEMLVLSAALAGLILFLVLCRLPELHHPIFEVEGFDRASQDRFWLAIDERDAKLVRGHTEPELQGLGASRVAWTSNPPRPPSEATAGGGAP